MKAVKFFTIVSCVSIFMLAGCVSTPTPVQTQEKAEEIQVEEPVEEIEAAPEVEVVDEAPAPDEDEYTRSTIDVSVSRDEFDETKKHLMHVIEKMDAIMKARNFNEWTKYIDSDSMTYYSQKSVLNIASNKLPKKGLKLKSLQDYFLWVFIPSRIGRTVDEIRYVTEDFVKVVHVEEDKDAVYYTFIHKNGEWKISLPEIND